MTAKKFVIHNEEKPPTSPDKKKLGEQKAPARTSDETVKIDIGLDKVVPAALAAQPGSKTKQKQGKAKPSVAEASARSGPKPEKSVKPIIVIPKPPVREKEFKFLCTSCGKKLKAPENAAGQTTQCPDCGNAITIPQPTAEPQTPKQLKRGVRYKKPKAFKFYCVRCGKSLEADRDQAETQIGCPQCKSVITVPQPADA